MKTQDDILDISIHPGRKSHANPNLGLAWYSELDRMNRCMKVNALLTDTQLLITIASATQSNPTIPLSQ